MASDKKWIQLNVGGTIFLTSRSTLTKASPPNSPLHRISSSSTNVTFDRDESGAYMIDRDPVFFQPVLNFMRHGRLFLNKDIPEEAILLEAEYFNLPELIKVLKLRIQNRRNLYRGGIPALSLNHINAHQLQHQNHYQHYQQPQQHHQMQALQHQTSPALQSNLDQVAPIASTSSTYPTLNSLISHHDRLSNFVNGILADDLSGGI